MRWLTIAVAVLAMLWGGYWWIGSTGVERGVQSGAQQLRDDGWQVEYSDLSVSGFPNRFDVNLDDPRIVSANGAVSWQAPFIGVYALSYRPNQVIVVFPDTQNFDIALGRIDITTADMRASAMVRPEGALPLDRATLVIVDLVASTAAGRIAIADSQLAIREDSDPTTYDVAFDAGQIVLPDGIVDRIGTVLPGAIDMVSVDAVVDLDRPLDRDLAQGALLQAVDLRAATLVWGDLNVAVRGMLKVRPDGLADGELVLEIADLDAVLSVLEQAIPASQRRFVEGVLRATPVDGQDGSGSLRLSIADNLILFGPFPVASLPRFPVH